MAIIRCQAHLIAVAHLRRDPFWPPRKGPNKALEGWLAVHLVVPAEHTVPQGA